MGSSEVARDSGGGGGEGGGGGGGGGSSSAIRKITGDDSHHEKKSDPRKTKAKDNDDVPPPLPPEGPNSKDIDKSMELKPISANDVTTPSDSAAQASNASAKREQSVVDEAHPKDGNKNREAICETILLASAVIFSLSLLLLVMCLLAFRTSTQRQHSTIRTEDPNAAWLEYYRLRGIVADNMCQKFPGDRNTLERHIRSPYQVIGDACEDYYEMVCTGTCEFIPYGLCFADVMKKYQRDCIDMFTPITNNLWREINTIFDYQSTPIAPESTCRTALLEHFREQLSVIHGGNTTLRLYLLDRILHMINYVNSMELCVERRLKFYEIFCLSLCCNLAVGEYQLELGRVICQTVVGWRDDFTTYFRCPQNRKLITTCVHSTPEPPGCIFAAPPFLSPTQHSNRGPAKKHH